MFLKREVVVLVALNVSDPSVFKWHLLCYHLVCLRSLKQSQVRLKPTEVCWFGEEKVWQEKGSASYSVNLMLVTLFLKRPLTLLQ